RRERRDKGSLFYIGNDEAPARDSIWHVRLRRDVRPGKLTIRDYDYRSRPGVALFGHSSSKDELEDRLEIYEYRHGAFLVEGFDGAALAPETHCAKTDAKE